MNMITMQNASTRYIVYLSIIATLFIALVFATNSTAVAARNHAETFENETIIVNTKRLYCPITEPYHMFGSPNKFAMLYDGGNAAHITTPEMLLEALKPTDTNCPLEGVKDTLRDSLRRCTISAASYGLPIQSCGIVAGGNQCNAEPAARFSDVLVDFARTRVIILQSNKASISGNQLTLTLDDPACAFIALSFPQALGIGDKTVYVQNITSRATNATLTLSQSMPNLSFPLAIDVIYMVHRASIYPTQLQMGDDWNDSNTDKPTGWTVSSSVDNITTIKYYAPSNETFDIRFNPVLKEVHITKSNAPNNGHSLAGFKRGLPNIAAIAAKAGMFKNKIELKLDLQPTTAYDIQSCISQPHEFGRPVGQEYQRNSNWARGWGAGNSSW